MTQQQPSISILVPRSAVPLILLTLLATCIFTYVHHYHLPALIRYLTRLFQSPPINQAAADSSQQQEQLLTSLRHEAARLNTPTTFAQHAKLQRQITTLQHQLHHNHNHNQPPSPHLAYTITYGALAGLVALLWWAGWSVVLAEVGGGGGWWMGWTPVRLVMGEIGVVRWSLVCYRAVSLVIGTRSAKLHVS